MCVAPFIHFPSSCSSSLRITGGSNYYFLFVVVAVAVVCTKMRSRRAALRNIATLSEKALCSVASFFFFFLSMRTSRLCGCVAPVQAWVAEYAERLGLERTPTCPTTDAALTNAASETSEDASSTLSPEGAAELRKHYQDARRAFLKGLRAYPFSYSGITKRPSTFDDEYRLRGLSNDDFVLMSTSSGAHERKATERTAEEGKGETAVTPSFASKNPVQLRKNRRATPLSPAPPVKGIPVRWPSLLQLTREVERYNMTRHYLWDIVVDRQQPSDPAHVSRQLVTTSDANGATPSLLALYPFSVLSRLAEHAVRHAWCGGPHIYPKGRFPDASFAFNFTGCPRLTLADVASQQWNRAEAARFLVAAMQHSSIQKDLRQRLWTAAQRYHRDILTDVDALAHASGGEAAEKQSRRVYLTGGRPTQHTTTIAVEDLKQQLFSFPAHVHYTVLPPAGAAPSRPASLNYRNCGEGRVVLQPLRSSHWFHFAAADSAVVEILAERPHTDVFLPGTPFAFVTGSVEGKSAAAAPRANVTTQDQLWLLLSEMVRLRLLVSYLLHLEVFLRNMRNATSPFPTGSRAAFDAPHAAATEASESSSAAQETHDALCVNEVFHFLDVQVHADLQRRSHNRRFLSKYQMRLEASEEGGNGEGCDFTSSGDALSENLSSSLRGRRSTVCFSTVQELFTAFTKAMEKGAGGEGRDAPACTAASAQDVHEGSDKLERQKGSTARVEQNTDGCHPKVRAKGDGQAAPLSSADASFLAAVLAPWPKKT